MLDIKYIRENPDKVKKSSQAKGKDIDIARLLKVDEDRRKTLIEVEKISAQKNEANKLIPNLKDEKEKKKLITEMQGLGKREGELRSSLKKYEDEFEKIMYQIPNPCFDDVPVGKDESANVVLREKGKKPNFKFAPKEYLEIAEAFDLIDVKRASKVSGSRFGYIKRELVLIEFALVNMAFETLSKEGFVPVIPPVLIKPEMMKGMGYVDSKEDTDERYYLEKDDLFLVGTSEQSVGPMHQGEILAEEDLPKRYVSFSSCFRQEAGSYGKDTKGILRVHQFDKVEMFSFSKPENSAKEHQLLLKMQEKLIKGLKLPYQVVQLSTGDTSNPAASTIDIEVWLPGQNQYREVSSTSNCTDFQARRLAIKYRKAGKTEFVHMLNGTAFAIGRILIAIIENNQDKDGNVKVPKALQKYLDFKVIKRK